METEKLAQNSEKTKNNSQKRGSGRPFEKGKSGNPGGRPKKTAEQIADEHEQEDALQKIKKLAPKAVCKAEEMLNDPEVAPNVKARIIEMILDRTYGKAFQSVKVEEESTNVTGVVLMPQRGDHD